MLICRKRFWTSIKSSWVSASLPSKGILKGLSFLSNQSRFRISRKINSFNTNELFNPFENQVRDTSLISSSTSIRNTFYFNRTGSVFSSDWTYQNNVSKSLLATGFDSRLHEFHEKINSF